MYIWMSEEVSCLRDCGICAKMCQHVRKSTLVYKSIMSFVLFRFNVIGWFLLQGCVSYLDFVQVIFVFKFVKTEHLCRFILVKRTMVWTAKTALAL